MRAELEERSRALGGRAECIRVAKHAHVYGTETAAVSASSRAANSNARHSRDIRIRVTFASSAPRPRRRPDLREPEPPHWAAENNGPLRRCESHITAVSGSTSRGPLAANRRNLRRSSRPASSPFAETAESAVCLAERVEHEFPVPLVDDVLVNARQRRLGRLRRVRPLSETLSSDASPIGAELRPVASALEPGSSFLVVHRGSRRICIFPVAGGARRTMGR